MGTFRTPVCAIFILVGPVYGVHTHVPEHIHIASYPVVLSRIQSPPKQSYFFDDGGKEVYTTILVRVLAVSH